jgi:hypothetical protein
MAKGKLLEITAKVSIITDPFTVSLADAGSSVDLDVYKLRFSGAWWSSHPVGPSVES